MIEIISNVSPNSRLAARTVNLKHKRKWTYTNKTLSGAESVEVAAMAARRGCGRCSARARSLCVKCLEMEQ